MGRPPQRAASGRPSGIIGVIVEGVAVVALGFTVVPILLVLVLALLAALIVGLFFACAYVSSFFPAYSAEFYIKERDTTVRLRFYDVWDSEGPVATEENSGRSLTVCTPDGQITQKMCGHSWIEHARTGIYLAGDHDIAVVGVDQCDYVISTRPFATSPAFKTSSDRWIYLGAFDIVDHQNGVGHGTPPHTRELRFIPADEEGECIDGKVSAGDSAVRNAARRASCSDIRHRD